MDQNSKLTYSVPPSVWLAIALLFFIQVVIILHLRGAGDPEGYLLNTSRLFSFNTYEDDGASNVSLALGHTESLPRYMPYAIDMGGSYLYLARLVLHIADRVGIITVFHDPSLYLLYPEAYQSVWKTFAIYKAVLLVLVPLSLYWLCANHFSKSSGILAVWMYAAMPFVPGFEPRLKVDALAVAVGLLSLMHQIQYVRTRKMRYGLYAAAWLGLSFSMKFIMAPAAITMFVAHVYCCAKGVDRMRNFLVRGLLAVVVCVAVYIAANPMVIPGSVVYFQAISKNLGENAVYPLGTLTALWRRWTSLDVFLGPIFPWLVLPSLLICLRLAFISQKHRFFFAMSFLLLALQTFYFSASFRGALGFITYYYYSHAILLLPLLAASLVWSHRRLQLQLPGLSFLITILIGLGLAAAFRSQLDVVRYMTSRTDRQKALAWIDRNLPVGASIGVPVEEKASVITSLIRLDPFLYRVMPVGKTGALARQYHPDYMLWVRSNPQTPPPEAGDYAPIARFDAGIGLPHNQYDLYQEEAFEVYAKTDAVQTAPINSAGWDLEYDIGRFMLHDPERQFNVMQFQGTHFYPISLNLFRKSRGTVRPFSTQAFTGAIRHQSSPLAYVHQADPLCTTLWGIKYVIADLRPQSAFVTQTLAAANTPFVLEKRLDPTFEDGPRPVGIFRNARYLGQVFFAPAPKEVVTLHRQHGRWLARPLKTYGKLQSEKWAEPGAVEALEVHLVMETDTLTDILIKSAGHSQSYLVGPGYHDLRLPFSPGQPTQAIDYEINPAAGAGRILVHALSAAPLRLEGTPQLVYGTVETQQAFARVASSEPGRVVFALPDHGRWLAEVDGQAVRPEAGPAGCVAVPVTSGEHFVALRTTF